MTLALLTRSRYHESTAGRVPTLAEQPVWPQGDRSAQLPVGINPWTDASNSTPIRGVWAGEVAPAGGKRSHCLPAVWLGVRYYAAPVLVQKFQGVTL